MQKIYIPTQTSLSVFAVMALVLTVLFIPKSALAGYDEYESDYGKYGYNHDNSYSYDKWTNYEEYSDNNHEKDYNKKYVKQTDSKNQKSDSYSHKNYGYQDDNKHHGYSDNLDHNYQNYEYDRVSYDSGLWEKVKEYCLWLFSWLFNQHHQAVN